MSLPYLADITRGVTCGSPKVDVSTLVPAGADDHTYQLTPADSARLAGADVVFYNGAGLERWARRKAPWHAVTEGLALHRNDPHVWHSPALVKGVARNISLALAKTPGAGPFPGCLEAFLAKVDEEAARLRSKVETVPAAARVIATNHDAFGYFGAELGITIIPVLGISSEGSLSPAQVRDVVRRLKEKKVGVIFLETGTPRNLVGVIARESGARVGGELFASGPGPQGSGAETLFAMWAKNLDSIIAALR